jgi:hypothetical protein
MAAWTSASNAFRRSDTSVLRAAMVALSSPRGVERNIAVSGIVKAQQGKRRPQHSARRHLDRHPVPAHQTEQVPHLADHEPTLPKDPEQH